jgi:hypothetical protein
MRNVMSSVTVITISPTCVGVVGDIRQRADDILAAKFPLQNFSKDLSSACLIPQKGTELRIGLPLDARTTHRPRTSLTYESKLPRKRPPFSQGLD